MIEWRWIYAAVACIAAITLGLLAIWLPAGVDGPKSRPLDELRAFNRLPVWQALGIGAIGFAGMFAVFSYLAPTMLAVTKVSAAWIPLGLVGFGIGGVIGNFAGGWLFDRLKLRAVWMVRMGVVMCCVSLDAHSLADAAAVDDCDRTDVRDGSDHACTDGRRAMRSLAAASHHAAFTRQRAGALLAEWRSRQPLDLAAISAPLPSPDEIYARRGARQPAPTQPARVQT